MCGILFLRCGGDFEPIAAECDIDMLGASGAAADFDLRT